MIDISLVVPNVPLKLILGSGSLLHFVLETLICLHFFNLIAFPVICVILWPVHHTNPTELLVASAASHIVATTIFFDRDCTFNARTRVCKKPLCVFGFRAFLLDPLSRQIAHDRRMFFQTTAKACALTTRTITRFINWILYFLKTIITSYSTAPLDVSTIICIWRAKITPVQFSILTILIQNRKYSWVWSDHVATIYQACNFTTIEDCLVF